MNASISWRQPQQLLKAYGLSPKKSFGQNFLMDEAHLAGIAQDVFDLFPQEQATKPCVEYGGGLGALTENLLTEALQVHCVERDRDLVPVLNNYFALAIRENRLQVHEADAAKFHLPFDDVQGVVCGNLPYHLTSTLLLKTCEEVAQLHGGVFLVQKEVAERFVAQPGSKNYSALSVWVQSLYEATITRHLPPGCFVPPPKVDSAVVKLRRRVPALLQAHMFPQLKTLVKQAFGQRRKTLRNNFKKQVHVQAHLEALGVSLGQRPETVPVETFVALVNRMQED
ncbi:MAG: ribosomal RNA small subunit methyltransferase A [Myxococcales bacterium]|nr:ribosomal RNA small subunit methyltransferase A [Myxococcales bacterium]|tara:strand:+ start:432 stop:1280 length:849 start_codon:yes stop_codon:yes gene_type:complete